MASRVVAGSARAGAGQSRAGSALRRSKGEEKEQKKEAEERETFDLWVHRKEVFDRGLQILEGLDDARWVDESQWKQLTESLCAIDESTGVNAALSVKGKVKRACMYQIWRRQSMEKHPLENVLLETAEYERLTEATRDYTKEQTVSDGGRSETRHEIPRVTYTFPAKPKKKGEQVKPLTQEQKTLNAVFLRMMPILWLAARDAVLEKTERLSLKLLENAVGESKEQEDKQGAEERTRKGATTMGPENGGGAQPSADELRLRALQVLGVNKLYKWADSDVDEIDKQAKASAAKKHAMAAKQFDGYLMKKKRLQLVLPQRDRVALRKSSEPPRFVFSANNPPLRQKKTKVVNTTADMMWDSGMRVVHALNAESDLRKSRTKLLDDYHYVHEKNFDGKDAYTEWKDERRTFQKGDRVGVWSTSVTSVKEPAPDVPELICGTLPGSKERGDMLPALVVADVAENDPVQVLVYGHTENKIIPARDIVPLTGVQKRRVAASLAYSEWLEQKRAREVACVCLRNIAPPDQYSSDATHAEDYWSTVEKELKIEDRVKELRMKEARRQRNADEAQAEEYWKEAQPEEYWKAVGQLLKKVDRTLLEEWARWSQSFGVSSYICLVLWDAFDPIGDDMRTPHYSMSRQVLKKLLRPGLSYKDVFDSIVQRKWLRYAAKNGLDPDSDEGTRDVVLPELKIFSANEIRVAFRDLGIALQPDEVNIVIDAFDPETKKGVNMELLLKFAGDNGPRDELDIRQKLKGFETLWIRTDHVTGLANKPPKAKTANKPPKTEEATGSGKVVSEIERRRQILEEFRVKSSIKEGEECHLSLWMKEDGKQLRLERVGALETLIKLSKERRDESRLRRLLQTGSPPSAPLFYCAQPQDKEVGDESLETSLLLCWRPPKKNSLVAFFSIEISGAKGSREQKENVFHEIFRDPPEPDEQFRYRTWIRGLEPGTSYTFRIRAFNGFGPGPFTWQTFTTVPARPMRPFVLARTPRSVTIRWIETESHRYIKELESHLQPAFDKDRKVSQSELREMLTRDHPGGAVNVAPGPSRNEAALAKKLKKRFCMRLDELGSSLLTWDTVCWILSGLVTRPCAEPDRTQIMYKVEKCVSLVGDEWRPLFVTKFGDSCVNALEPGEPCRIRVVAVNDQDWQSRPSQSLVVTPFLDAPRPPTIVKVASTHVQLRWPGVSSMARSRSKTGANDETRIVNEWTKTSASNEGPVNIEALFKQISKQRTGDFISSADLGRVLERLGVPATPVRIADAWEQLGGDKTVELQEFLKWWDAGPGFVEIRRSVESLEKPGKPTCSDMCFRGRGGECKVSGLEPNTAYLFTLQAFFPRSQTVTSSPVRVVTAPAKCQAPVVVKTISNEVLVRWFPEDHGASRYVLEGRMVEALDATGGDKAAQMAQKKIKDRGWKPLFEGKEFLARIAVSGSATSGHGSALYPNSAYELRLVAISSDGLRSEPSGTCKCRTLNPRSSRGDATLRPAKVNEAFSMECTGDLVLGDTVVFTEKLRCTPSGKVVFGTPRGKRGIGSVGIPQRGPQSQRYVGERTIAGEIIFDSDMSTPAQLPQKEGAETRRWFRIKVLWSTVSSLDLESHILHRDSTIERKEQDLYEFEVFRVEWDHEGRRRPLAAPEVPGRTSRDGEEESEFFRR